MLLKITIVLAVIFQVIAAYQALKLTKRTKYNFSWIMISVGIAALLIRRVVEFLPLVSNFQAQDFRLLYIWVGVLSSLFLALGLLLIRQIFNYIDRMEAERREAEKQLLSSVIVTEESERKRLARELHDGLGPLMSGIRMSVSALQKQLTNEKQKQIAGNANKLVQEALKSVKDISTNLSPHMLENFGLVQALKNFINKISASSELSITFNTTLKNKKFPHKIEIIVYRVICEMLTNTVKHAAASRVSIDIEQTKNALLIDYSDDGKGFNLQDMFNKKQGMGLSNMYSRVASINGSVDIDTAKEKGTFMKIYIPLNHDEF
ncbi:MAG: sensor histidine kinase [Candidatus Delongbacteria bacterium]|jgi:signal transduction histidine kinase|nr:sensor histidine kinase [Candidatus Delongbacteria bacterium]